jgi:hypothetical protein
MKDMKDICAAARIAIVDQILSCGETPHATSDVARGLARIWMLPD